MVEQLYNLKGRNVGYKKDNWMNQQAVVTKVTHKMETGNIRTLDMEIAIPGEVNRTIIQMAVNDKLKEIFPDQEKEGIHKTLENLITRNRINNNARY